MSTQSAHPNDLSHSSKPITGGLILIALGLVFLIGQFIQQVWYGQLALAGLGVAFLAAGLLQRNNGLLIPGGILGGLSLGIAAQTLLVDATDARRGGVFLLCFAAGWVLISLLSFTTGRLMTWPLIPGVILALIGGALAVGGLAATTLRWFGAYGWPLILIAIGIAVLFRRRNA